MIYYVVCPKKYEPVVFKAKNTGRWFFAATHRKIFIEGAPKLIPSPVATDEWHVVLHDKKHNLAVLTDYPEENKNVHAND